ncbi:hypothetical protein [Stenotrophomonas maltophilia]|uniref:hypothetical protein n=1 Tax=Stenotrophomonas maltophilia TaxID=40324 RepID=UPI0015EC260A|nr:hypothetical protein [Stenotrophomonas maltophilia]
MSDIHASRALICRPDGTIEELDLTLATSEEAALAITDHRDLEWVRAVVRAIHDNKETP